MIYFATAREIGLVKIGYAADPERRLKVLQTGCPSKMTIEATIEGDQKFEAELHRLFAPHRKTGEWFDLAPAIEMAIHWIRSGADIPDDVEKYGRQFILAAHPDGERIARLLSRADPLPAQGGRKLPLRPPAFSEE